MNSLVPLSLWLVAALASPAFAGAPVVLELKNHHFSPSAILAHAGEPITIQLVNRDMATEEFDSHDLRVERLVTPGGKVTFQVGPLKAGDYRFAGEFHPGTAQGRILVTP